MTETILLQLLADIRAVFRARTKPITAFMVIDALVDTESRDHTRYCLRVLDILVATGELVLELEANTCRRIYQRGPKGDAKDSGTKVLELFRYDIEEGRDGLTPTIVTAAPQPSGRPAATVPKAEPAPEPAPRKITIAPPPLRPASPVNPSTVPLFMPGAGARVRVLALIESQPTVTRHHMRQALRDITKATLDNTLLKLKTEGLIASIAPGEYQRCADDPMARVTPAFEGPVQSFRPSTDPLDQAFDALRNRIERKPVSISDLDLKLRTLNRLGELLDPDIRNVLSAISSDLRQVAA